MFVVPQKEFLALRTLGNLIIMYRWSKHPSVSLQLIQTRDELQQFLSVDKMSIFGELNKMIVDLDWDPSLSHD